MNPYWMQAQKAMANRKPIQYPPEFMPFLPNTYKPKANHDIRDYEIKHVGEHVEVYKDGKFKYSADTEQEARHIFNTEPF